MVDEYCRDYKKNPYLIMNKSRITMVNVLCTLRKGFFLAEGGGDGDFNNIR
jgi:hypothetical protein